LLAFDHSTIVKRLGPL